MHFNKKIKFFLSGNKRAKLQETELQGVEGWELIPILQCIPVMQRCQQPLKTRELTLGAHTSWWLGGLHVQAADTRLLPERKRAERPSVPWQGDHKTRPKSTNQSQPCPLESPPDSLPQKQPEVRTDTLQATLTAEDGQRLQLN